MAVSKVKGQHKLDSKPVDHQVRQPAVFKPRAEAPEGFSHELKHKTDVCPIGALVLEIVDEVANVDVAELTAVPVAKMSEDLPLEDGLVLAVGLGAQHLEGPESVLIVVAGEQNGLVPTGLVGRALEAIQGLQIPTHDFVRSLTSQTVE